MRQIIFYKINYNTEEAFSQAIENFKKRHNTKVAVYYEKKYKNKTIITYQLKKEQYQK
jgi:hypothetical protein